MTVTSVTPVNQTLETPEKPLTTGEWFVTLLVLALPIVGLVMHFVWGFGTGGNVGRRNFCRAALIWLGIGFGLAILTMIAMLIFGGTLAALLGQSVPRR
jgi:ABC-type Fe3+ transport system permease subunit